MPRSASGARGFAGGTTLLSVFSTSRMRSALTSARGTIMKVKTVIMIDISVCIR